MYFSSEKKNSDWVYSMSVVFCRHWQMLEYWRKWSGLLAAVQDLYVPVCSLLAAHHKKLPMYSSVTLSGYSMVIWTLVLCTVWLVEVVSLCYLAIEHVTVTFFSYLLVNC